MGAVEAGDCVEVLLGQLEVEDLQVLDDSRGLHDCGTRRIATGMTPDRLTRGVFAFAFGGPTRRKDE